MAAQVAGAQTCSSSSLLPHLHPQLHSAAIPAAATASAPSTAPASLLLHQEGSAGPTTISLTGTGTATAKQKAQLTPNSKKKTGNWYLSRNQGMGAN